MGLKYQLKNLSRTPTYYYSVERIDADASNRTQSNEMRAYDYENRPLKHSDVTYKNSYSYNSETGEFDTEWSGNYDKEIYDGGNLTGHFPASAVTWVQVDTGAYPPYSFTWNQATPDSSPKKTSLPAAPASLQKTAASGAVCSGCGEALLPGAKFCPLCETKVQGKVCAGCGAALAPAAKFCPSCGAKAQ
jgi:hypothetical protein